MHSGAWQGTDFMGSRHLFSNLGGGEEGPGNLQIFIDV